MDNAKLYKVLAVDLKYNVNKLFDGVPADINAIRSVQETLAFLADTVRDLDDCLEAMIKELED